MRKFRRGVTDRTHSRRTFAARILPPAATPALAVRQRAPPDSPPESTEPEKAE